MLMSSLAALPSILIGRLGSCSQMMPPYWWFSQTSVVIEMRSAPLSEKRRNVVPVSQSS